jgi:hypothetical protein
MELPPVAPIAAISPVKVKRNGEDAATPFAIDGILPLTDESHCASAEDGGDLEDDELGDLEDEKSILLDSDPGDPPKKVDFFA